jgi:hypothetical protein
MTPLELLDAAGKLMLKPPASMQECWPRSCAGLIRVALEQGLEGFYQGTAPSLVGRARRHQLIALPQFLDPASAREVAAVWNGLSRAMHHHVYELPPTLAELREWHASVAHLLPLLT